MISDLPPIRLSRCAPLAAAIGLALGCAGTGLAEEGLSPDPSAADEAGAEELSTDSLSQAALQEAFSTLRRSYVRPSELEDDELNRAALAGLLEELGPGARLVRSPASEDPSGPTDEEPQKEEESLIVDLGEDVTYLRPVLSGGPKGLGLEAISDPGAPGALLILDLRIPGDSFALAALLAETFVEEGAGVFRLRQEEGEKGEVFLSKPGDKYRGDAVLLIDGTTGPAAEIAAAAIHSEGSTARTSISFGETTPGRPRYERIPLGDGISLEFAGTEAVLPEGNSQVFGAGLVPDVTVGGGATSPPPSADAVLAAVAPEPPIRFSEAALVAGTHPALAARLAEIEAEAEEVEGAPADPATEEDDEPVWTDRVLRVAYHGWRARLALEPPAPPGR